MLTRGDLGALAGVYTISFLSVMALFAVGNILLKVRRARLPRQIKASWPAVLIGVAAVLVALVGNATMNPKYLRVFFIYFIPTVLAVGIMLGRTAILRTVLFMVRGVSDVILERTAAAAAAIRAKIDQINSQQVVFFTRGDSVANLNQAMLYVAHNEHTNRIKVVTVYEQESDIPARLEKDLDFLDQAYPLIHIEFLAIKGTFGPKLIHDLSAAWNIPTNFMFIGSPGDHFPHRLEDLGGVRLIV